MASSNGWPSRPLKDCAVWYSGGTPNKATPRYWGGTIPWISAKSITGFFISDSEDRVTEDGARNGTRLVPPNTILFIVRGMSLKSEFRMGITTRPVTFNQDLKALVAVEDVVPAFLAYAIKARTGEILGLVGEAGHGTGVLPTDRIQSLEIPIPSLPEQRAIAHVIGTIDDKIELNRRMNETLEAMARALFKSWFVDFDPVRAKAEGRQPSGMDADTAKLFPSGFIDSELGPIPKGWRHVPVRDTCAGLFDGPHATPPESDSGAIFLGIKNFTPTSLELADVRYISEDDYPKWTKRVVPAAGDIVFTYEATLGFFAIIPPGIRCCLGRRTALIRPRDAGCDAHFLFEWFVAPPFQEFLRAHRQPGSTVDRIWLKDFPGYPVLRPPDELVSRFETVIAPLWARIHAGQAEATTLRGTRDVLLPRLLSGELSVAQADSAVEVTA